MLFILSLCIIKKKISFFYIFYLKIDYCLRRFLNKGLLASLRFFITIRLSDERISFNALLKLSLISDIFSLSSNDNNGVCGASLYCFKEINQN